MPGIFDGADDKSAPRDSYVDSQALTAPMGEPVKLREPELPYDRALYFVALGPTIDGKTINANLSITVRPCRLLSDGTWDVAPQEMCDTLNLTTAAAMTADQASLFTMLQEIMRKLLYVSAKG